MAKVSIVYHSEYGHTEVIARCIKEGVESLNSSCELMKCDDLDWQVLNESQAIIFGCPTYMGSTSAEFKKFMDSSSDVWRKQLWRNKIAAGFTNSVAMSGDKLSTLFQLSLFAFQHGMAWVGLDLMAGNCSSKGSNEDLNRIGSWLGLMTQSNSDEAAEISPPQSDRETAKYFGKRVALFAQSLKIERY
jgi:NAD(P)H dehydrogenase (quinone)